MTRTVARFAVRAVDGRRASEWRVWTGKQDGMPTDDVYLAPRQKIPDFKISLHKDGWAQVGLSQAVRRAARVGDRHALSRWQMATEPLIDGWRPAFRLNFPESQLVLGPAIDAQVIRVGEPRSGMAIAVLILVGEPGAELPPWLDSFQISMLDRRNGGRVAILRFELPLNENLLAVSPPGPTWDMPGTQAPPGPYGWAQSVMPDGTRVWTEFSQTPEPNTPLDLPGFTGDVLTWDQLPADAAAGELSCAILLCPAGCSPRLYIDTRSRCNHSHLAYDVGVLVDAYRDGALDEGWTVYADGSACTALMPRRRAEEAGLDPANWSPSPRPQRG